MKLKLRKGFTLIELMIVVCIIIILASISVSSYTRYTASARRAKCISNLRAIHEARLAWVAVNATGTIPELPDLVHSGYFRGPKGTGKDTVNPNPTYTTGPNCPAGGKYTYELARTDVEIKPACNYSPVSGDEAHKL